MEVIDRINLFIKKFGFKGVGLSGGEPLLTFGTTIDFLSKIKKNLGVVQKKGKPSIVILIYYLSFTDFLYHLNRFASTEKFLYICAVQRLGLWI